MNSSSDRPFSPATDLRFRPPWPNHYNRTSTMTPPRRSNFVIYLRSSPFFASSRSADNIDTIISRCNNVAPSDVRSYNSRGPTRASLHFQEWTHALDCIVSLWDLRLSGTHNLTPILHSVRRVDSDAEELDQRLKAVFRKHIETLIDGDDRLLTWQHKAEEKSEEIAKVERLLGDKNSMRVFTESYELRKGLMKERDLILKRVREFQLAMNCVLRFLGSGEGDEIAGSNSMVDVLMFEGKINWERIHCSILRELKRLEDGLPIYAYREKILEKIHCEQVMVLIGETGSGKSTQLAQFLTDSGFAAKNCIVCTQPRKIAALSLAERVKEESKGCYDDNSVVSLPTFSSTQQFTSKIAYTTDHCLLQHYMMDRSLSGISCIIVDEAHERSLNTDLLLALIKDLLQRRFDLRLVIMSATANANQLSDYFFGCGIFHVEGRNFPVDVKYVPIGTDGDAFDNSALYAYEVVRKTKEIHKSEKEGAILAFLTSQMEVEWACENFGSPFAVALPLHGKLSSEEQHRIFKNYPGKRKVIFATNIAETSLTIPGVKYVVDSGLVKASSYDPGTGMNALRVCRISQSSAQQRAGRAGRTGPGICYRLYTEIDFEEMPPNEEPEIRRVHLGIAVLRILALGVKNVQEFDFVDAPSNTAINMAIQNLVQLGAITLNNGVYELTHDGCYLVKLGVEPRLGKVVLSCIHHRVHKEGVVLAAVMANASSIFCRIGNDDSKKKSDCLKVKFCHHYGDLFTLLSVYRAWEEIAPDKRNKWCWENSINAKSMRRCQDTVKELEICLQKELNVIIPSYWCWDPCKSTEHDKSLKKVILSAFRENVAMYSGYDRLGYKVALMGQHVQLHPSSSLLMFSDKPSWVVFCELLSTSNQYLLCVSSFDFELLSTLSPPILFDASEMEKRKLQVKVMSGFGSTLLKRFCGKSNTHLRSLESAIRAACMDDGIYVETNTDQNEILVYAISEIMDKAFGLAKEAVEYQQKLLSNECIEKCLYHGAGVSSPVALFGAGAEIKHLELEKRFLSVNVCCSSLGFNEKELLTFLEKKSGGNICAIHKSSGYAEEESECGKWGSLTFLTPDAAAKASELNQVEFNGLVLNVVPSCTTFGGDHRMCSFPAVRAKIFWPRRCSKGLGIVKCNSHDVNFMISDFFNLVIGGKTIRAEISRKSPDSIVIIGIDKGINEFEVGDALRRATKRRILDFFLVKGDPVENPLQSACEEAILKEISAFMPKMNSRSNCCRVQVLPAEPKDAFMKALITFDGRLHLEAARALENIDGKVLPGCLPWQKIKCQHMFHSSLSCSASVFFAVEKQLRSLLARFKRVNGAECSLNKNDNGSYRVKISANATKVIAEIRRPLEQLMNGRIIRHPSLTPPVLQYLFSKDSINLMKTIQQETGTYILFDRHTLNVKLFGHPDKVDTAEQKLVQALVTEYEKKQLEIHLRGSDLPPNLMKEVVNKFGPDLSGLKQMITGAEFSLNTRRHVISIRGARDMKQKVEEIILEIAMASNGSVERLNRDTACPICLCEVEDGYQLEGCTHIFCRLCLVEQLESAVRNLDSFPVCCAYEGCKAPILLADMRALLSAEKLEELFRASLGSYVASSRGTYRFCPSPDCPSIYRVAEPGSTGEPFVCGACYAETCTSCHLEYHPYLSCERYRIFKEDPDSSLKEWRKDKDNVKCCPECGYTIEKVDGCNHIECKCGKHICWVCLRSYGTSDQCYEHLRTVHVSIN